MSNKNIDPAVYSAMQENAPIASYRKEIPAQVFVWILDPFSDEPQGIILKGNPGEPDSIYRAFTVKQKLFFERMNKTHLDKATIKLFQEVQPTQEPEKTPEQMSDDEIKVMLKKPFYTLQSVLNETESEAFVYRILQSARELEKSEKIIRLIETRLAELQNLAVSSEE